MTKSVFYFGAYLGRKCYLLWMQYRAVLHSCEGAGFELLMVGKGGSFRYNAVGMLLIALVVLACLFQVMLLGDAKQCSLERR